MVMRLFILALILRILPGSYKPYIRMAVALEPVFTPEAAEQLAEVAEDGEITWADWMRIGRRAGLKSEPKG